MRTPATKFEDLVVWQKAHQFVLGVYRLSQAFPRSEPDGLTSQFRRAAVSIAEGFKKRGKADRLRFFNIAQGSLEEGRYYLMLARDLEYGGVSDLNPSLEEVSNCWRAMLRPFWLLTSEFGLLYMNVVNRKKKGRSYER